MILHIVDDDETILDAMQFMLKGLNIDIKTWNSSHKFINEANLYEEGVVFLDIRMPIFDGQQVHQYLRSRHSFLSVVIMTAHGEIPLAVQALKHGAVDFLQKPLSFEQTKQAIKVAQEVSQNLVKLHHFQHCYDALTAKEKALIPYIMEGITNKQIANLLNISMRTVEVHRANIMQKMESSTLAQLVYKITKLNEI